MLLLIALLNAILLPLTIVKNLPIGWLLFCAIALVAYCTITILNKNEKLTTIGKTAMVFGILNIIYCLTILFGIHLF